ncbi:MAG: bifunctional proline dehydrogenase/L-glutamate gamma-semialdehyde dehydrogenase [Acidobacteriota bacterium]|nr:bifunctional proline dehydrogenase/L-glutamate gamma-semialdehyde dehydrogenase [Acidobacteriota bacterium]
MDALLASLAPDSGSPSTERARKAVFLARQLQETAAALQTPVEARQQAELERMVQSPHDKATLTQLTDQAFRSNSPHRAVDQILHILDVQGIPRFFSGLDRTLLRGFRSFGSYLPGVAAPLVKERMREETANVVLPAEEALLGRHLEARRQGGVRMNVNFLGEALLGESEAQRRLESYLRALQLPELEVISVKISTIYSQISSLAFEQTVSVLCDRMELLYRAAARERFRRRDGTEAPKFVYLDMEEYRDLAVTTEVFLRTLARKGLEHAGAGIALQAYLPDSYLAQKRINAWARERVNRGGAPVTIRLVKGANLEMERVEASLRGWKQAPFRSKLETDANFKRMLHEALTPENIAAVRLGVASHNLFDVSYALLLAAEAGALDRVQFEMLEGMANAQRRALFELTQNVLLYAPATRKEDFINAIGYLFRRLDENTGPDNFLRHAFRLVPDSPEWKRLEEGFLESSRRRESVSEKPRRVQNRLAETGVSPRPGSWSRFVNEPDTDFSLPANREWAQGIIERWKPRHGEHRVEVPLVVDGREIFRDRELQDCLDPSRPGLIVGRYRQANEEDVERAVACARNDPDGWRRKPVKERSQVLAAVARELRRSRGDLMGAALADGGKTLSESDPEVSEVVDFVVFYDLAARYFQDLPGSRAEPKGVVVVVSPWNFPIAIPGGGIAAALAAGNTVILKPSPDTVLVAHELCRCFWRAGVSRRTLQMAPCAVATGGSRLVSHPAVDAVILTGGTETALRMLRLKPDMNLLAETGGKNAATLTALGDRELAISHVIHSAFSHSGQKCSATSLLLVEEETCRDPKFKETLCDAVRSLEVGSAWDRRNRMGPLIRPPSGALERGLKELEPGESWAVMPRRMEDNPCLYSPGVKWDVRPGSFTHLTELFGPVLGVMRVKNLDEALGLIRQTGYGLTAGLESLDDREQAYWCDRVDAGNLYVNRGTTGAVVLRQPFGGMAKSAFGPGIKAGGPNYVSQLMNFSDTEPPNGPTPVADPHLAALRSRLKQPLPAAVTANGDELPRVVAALESYWASRRDEFGRTHDHFRLVGQDNLRRYLPVRRLCIRVDPSDSLFEIFARACAAKAAGCRAAMSLPRGWSSPAVDWLRELTGSWEESIEFIRETDHELADRVRFAMPERVPGIVFRAAAASGVYLARTPVLAQGRVELLWYLREQSISIDYHRYGNLGIREGDERMGVS